jgi:hypothetical protein
VTRRAPDRQLELGGGFFEAEAPGEPTPGSFDLDQQLRGWVRRAIKDSPLDREEIAAEMTRLVGLEPDEAITKAQIDAWTAPSKTAWSFPVKYLSVFVRVTHAYWLLDKLASPCGCRVLVGEESLIAQAILLEHQEREAAERRAAVLKKLSPDAAQRLARRGRA